MKNLLLASTTIGIALGAGTASAQLDYERTRVISLDDVQDTSQLDSEFGYSLTSAGRSLIIGAPNLSIDGKKAGGIFQIVADNDFDLAGATLWSQASNGVVGAPEAGDRFGHSLAAARPTGDDNCNSSALNAQCWVAIVGVPYEGIGDKANAGMVNMVPAPETVRTWAGTADKTPIARAHQNVPRIVGKAESGDRFGWSVTSGDFNGDGGDDIAIGVTREDTGKYTDSGSINTIMGDPVKQGDTFAEYFTTFRNRAFTQASLKGTREDEDKFGWALASGDFNGDGTDDIAVGAVGHPNSDTAGEVNIIYGEKFRATGVAEGGPDQLGNELIDQDVKGISGEPESGDMFGAALAAGDFNGDGVDDLAIGVPNEDIGNRVDAGMVHIVYGTEVSSITDSRMSGGLLTGGNPITGPEAKDHDSFHQNSSGMTGAAEAGDRFGAALAAGDLNGDDFDDLVIGIPGEDIGDTLDAGGAIILFGESSGLSSSGNIYLTQARAPSIAENISGMRFGQSLAIGPFSGESNQMALAVGNGSNIDPNGRHDGGSRYDDLSPVDGKVWVFVQER